MTEYGVGSTHEYSATLLITPRSTTSEAMILVDMTDQCCRVLIATIRDMGGCPCPRCTVTKSDLDKAGSDQDAKNRVNHTRIDNDEFRGKVKAARTEIFENGYTIDSSARVEPILKPESLVPTEVHVDRIVAELPH